MTLPNPATEFQKNVQAGIKRGLAIGAFFATGSVLLVLLRGPSALEGYRISLLGLITYDLIGGAVTGAIVGSLLPVANRNSGGAALVGFIAMLPASVVAMLLVTPSGEWRQVVPVGSLVAAALLGGLSGPLFRSQDRGEATTNWRFVAIVVSVGVVLGLLMFLAGWW
jgi:uncharacterized membrane protein YsdA (DUF1294 family)